MLYFNIVRVLFHQIHEKYLYVPQNWSGNQRIKIFQSVSRCFSLFQKAAHYLTKGGTTEIKLQKM